jgi:diaminopropionate ammonia-lyase
MSVGTSLFSPTVARQVRRFFGQDPTPLVPLRGLASKLGLAGIYAKDESKRLGQQAFKVYGGTYAMAVWISKAIGVDLAEVASLQDLRTRYFKDGRGPTTFVTCTDGNHGRAVAWAAKQLGQKAVVFMPKGSAAARVEHVRSHGGECTVTELNYDHTVEYASEQASKNGWVLLQDTTLPGYTEIPTWIMQGYTAMADEALEQMLEIDGIRPTHVLLQVGVGSMAGAVSAYLSERAAADGTAAPIIVTLEPKNAACAFETAKRGDGKTVTVEGDLETMIAGLACGELSTLGWPILAKEVRGGYCWIEDDLAGNGMRLLSSEGVEGGECGGAAPGLLQRLMDPHCKLAAEVRTRIGLEKDSRVLFFNTEGATDPDMYKRQMALAHVDPSSNDFDFVGPLPAEAGGPTLLRARL